MSNETYKESIPNNECRNCAHWSKDTRFDYPKNFGGGACKKVKLFFECHQWDYVNDSDDLEITSRPDMKENKAFLQDGSDYAAELVTLPDFGCNQYEAKQ